MISTRKCVSCILALTLLTGCAVGGTSTETAAPAENITADEEINEALSMKKDDIASMDKLTFEQIATAREGSSTDRIESLVYQYVSDSVTVDTTNLGVVNETTDPTALMDIDNVIKQVNNSLKTGLSSSIVDDSIINYMLLEFANTPYSWEYDDSINSETGMANSIQVRGMDAATHLYFVDVTYHTGQQKKTVLPTSTIVRGSDNEDELRKKLYADYITYIADAKNDDGTWNYDEKGYPVFNNGHPTWDNYAAKERSTADAMYQLIFGKRYDSVMYGWTADGVSDGDSYTIYEDYTVDDMGNVLVVYRRSDTNAIVFDEYTKPENFVSGMTFTSEGVSDRVDDGSFESRWGSLEELYLTQNDTTLMERLKLSNGTKDAIGVYTYPGLIESAEATDATLTFRFVLEYAYNIGVSDFMNVRSVYLYDYDTGDLQEQLTNTYTTETVKSRDVLSPFIEKTLDSYRKAVVSENHRGLYNLFVTYDKYDRYISDIAQYTYLNNGGFTFDILGRKGDEVAVLVKQRVQKRAKGTNMTYPTYIDTNLMKLKLCDDDKVRIVSVTLLNTEIIGEPISIIRDVSGVSSQIEFEQGSFTDTNQTLIENCIAQFLGNTIGFDDSKLLPSQMDIGVADNTRLSIKETLKSITSEANGADKLVVFIKNYPTKSNIYTSVNLRIVYVKSGTPTCEVNSVISLINRNGTWGIVNYTVDSLLDNASVAGADGCFVKITGGDTIDYVFPGRDNNDMSQQSDENNDIHISDGSEQNWSDEEKVRSEAEEALSEESEVAQE